MSFFLLRHWPWAIDTIKKENEQQLKQQPSQLVCVQYRPKERDVEKRKKIEREQKPIKTVDKRNTFIVHNRTKGNSMNDDLIFRTRVRMSMCACGRVCCCSSKRLPSRDKIANNRDRNEHGHFSFDFFFCSIFFFLILDSSVPQNVDLCFFFSSAFWLCRITASTETKEIIMTNIDTHKTHEWNSLSHFFLFFFQTHWHSFFVLADVRAAMIFGARGTNPLKRPPLVPTILPLPRNNDDMFK